MRVVDEDFHVIAQKSHTSQGCECTFFIPFVVLIVRFTEITAIAAVVYNFNLLLLLLFPCFVVVVYCLLFFFIIIPFAECNQ